MFDRFGTIRASNARIGRGEIIHGFRSKREPPRMGPRPVLPFHPFALAICRVLCNYGSRGRAKLRK